MDELISRKAVLDIIEDVMPIYSDNYHYILEEKINELPTIPQTAIKHFGAMECPNCGALFYEVPTIETVLDDIKTEILKQMLDEPPKDGTNGEMCCYNNGLFLATEIIDKHIVGKEML